nr:hypothetical protein [Tanacetum cinerariifolium]
MVDAQLSTRLEDSIKKSFRSYTVELEKKAKDKRKRYIDLVEKSVKEIVKDEVKTKSSSQPKSTYEAAASLTEFELKKILLDKIQKIKSYRGTQEHKDLYNALEPYHFDELISTPIDLSTYVMNNLKIENLTQKYLVGPAFNLLKGTCKSRVELEYYFEECYKAVTDRLDWMNPEGHEYLFNLSKPLPLIEDQGRQVVPANYFFNNDLEYLKGGSLSRKYITSTTKTKATKYDNIDGIEDMVPSLWSLVKVVTHVKVVKWYDYGYLEEIEVRREDQQLYKFREGNFPRLNLRNIEDMLLLLVQKKHSNLEREVIYDLNVALQMFTRRVIILKRVEDLQMAFETY